MAQLTTLSPAGVPGRTYTFAAKAQPVYEVVTRSVAVTQAVRAKMQVTGRVARQAAVMTAIRRKVEVI